MPVILDVTSVPKYGLNVFVILMTLHPKLLQIKNTQFCLLPKKVEKF